MFRLLRVPAACLILALAICLSIRVTAQQPVITNGGFEALGPTGFPVDWEAVGQEVTVSPDAHSGKCSLRLLRQADAPTRETGLNRQWQAHSGQGGKMLPAGKGGIRFWYKAISADEAQLNVYIIPMSDKPLEDTGERRIAFTVPQAHVSDGQWHPGALAYDFTRAPKVKWFHVAARIVGKAGELLLDDFEWVQSVGPILQIADTKAFEPLELGVVEMRAKVKNVGDQPLANAVITLTPPAGTRTDPTGEIQIGPLPPDEQTIVRWKLLGSAPPGSRLGVMARAGQQQADDAITLQPRLECLAALAPSLIEAGEEATLSLSVRNRGFAASEPIRRELHTVQLRVMDDEMRDIGPLAPGEARTVTWTVKATGASGMRTAKVRDPSQPRDDATTINVACAVMPRATHPNRQQDVIFSWSENRRLRFVGTEQGYGPAAIEVREDEEWRPVGWIPWLGQVRYVVPQVGTKSEALYGQRAGEGRFVSEFRDIPGGRWTYEFRVAPQPTKDVLHLTCRLVWLGGDPGARLDGPPILAGERSYGPEKEEALFPGLEWLEGTEISSSDLDISLDHKDRPRFEPHPNKITIPCMAVRGGNYVVGVLWDVPRSEGERLHQVGASFCSPDYINGRASHRMQLFLPAPEQDNQLRLAPLAPSDELSLDFYLWVGGKEAQVTDVLRKWFEVYGVPAPNLPPRGSYAAEIGFSMTAYLQSLWDSENQSWHHHLGGPAVSKRQGYFPNFMYDVMRGAELAPQPEVREECRKRLELIASREKVWPSSGDLGLWRGQPIQQLEALLAGIDPLLSSRHEDGSWRFDADKVDRGVFIGMDYRELGPDEAAELGTCAQKAYRVLRAAMVAGDEQLFEQVRPTLDFMKRFRVPRAAQVWEVPVHTPDILAAADAVDAYVEAYRFSGEEQYLEEAKRWAWAGLPFLYVWDLPDRPFLKYASIPVFGATWYRGSWFGRPVQWNGLRYANAVMKLAAHDGTFPWRRVAEGVTRSALYQQAAEGPEAALWPDSIGAIDLRKSAWVFAPYQPLDLIYEFIGRGAEPRTVPVRVDGQRVHLTSRGDIRDVKTAAGRLEFDLTYLDGEQGYTLLTGVSQPTHVLIDDIKLRSARDVVAAEGSVWQYYPPRSTVLIKLAVAGKHHVVVEGIAPRRVEVIIPERRRIDFDFRESTEGWLPANDIADFGTQVHWLVGRITGGDPFMVRPRMLVDGSSVASLRIRMRVTAGSQASVFWTTRDSPAFAEDKRVHFPIQGDGEWREYSVPVGEHPMWRGKTITALRIDPNSAAPNSDFAMDFVHGEP